MKFKVILVILFCVGFSMGNVLHAETWHDYFRDGIHYYNIGDYEKASDSLQMALEMNPSGKELKAARDGIGPAFWSKLLENHETRTVGYKLLQAVYLYEQHIREDDEYIRGLVEVLVSSETDFQKRWVTVHKIVAVGQFACPYLINYLGIERNEDSRKAAIMALQNLSYRAVLPLIEALNSENLLVKGNAITILGIIGDPRAAAALQAIVEFRTESENIKEVARKSLIGIQANVLKSKVFGENIDIIKDDSRNLIFLDHRAKGLFDKNGNFKPAQQLFLYKALRYLRETEYVAEESARDESVIWGWSKKNSKLEYRRVAPYAYNELMAEEAAYDCLNLYPEYEEIIPVLISSIAAQIVEVENLIQVVGDRSRVSSAKAGESKEDLYKRLEVVKEAFVLVNMVGPKYLYKALEITCQRIARIMDRKLKKNSRLVRDYEEYGFDAATFQYICEQLSNPEIGQWDKYLPLNDDPSDTVKAGTSLVVALDLDDKQFRYPAAISLAHLNPTRSFRNENKVVGALTKALGESKKQVILTVSKSMNDLNRLSSLVSGLGYVAEIANSGSEGLKKASQFPIEDIIIVDARDYHLFLQVDAFGNRIEAEYEGQTVEDFVKRIKEDLYTKKAPIIFVVSDEEQQVRYDNDVFFKDKVTAYIRWAANEPIDETYFADVIENVIHETEVKEKNAEDALAIAASSAIALSKIDIDKGVLGKYVSEAIPTLIKVIESRDDPIRLPSIEALGLYRATNAIQSIIRVLNHPRSAKDIRLACIRALGRINPADKSVYNALKDALRESDFDIRKEAAVALGHTSLDSTQLLELLEQQRIEKEAKER